MPKEVRKDLSYFTLDCNIFSKTAELRPLLRKFKADGLSVYVHILCDVYGTTGYYFKPEDYEGYLLDIAEDCGISVEKVQLIIAFMADRTLLDAFSLNKNTVFTSHGIQKRYAQAMKGRKRSVAEIKGDYWILTEEEESKINTFYKSHPSEDKSEKIDDKSEKIDDKSEIYNTTEHNRNKQKETDIKIPPTSPPWGDVDRCEEKERFFNSYPKLRACKKYEDRAVDYTVLIERFSNSEHLRNTYSMNWICNNYELIARGEFDDKKNVGVKTVKGLEVAADFRAERERYYERLRQRSLEREQEAYRKAEQSPDFKREESERKTIEIELAKAEIYDPDKANTIRLSLMEIMKRRADALRKIGMSEEELLPKYVCEKCSDTGFLKNGKICDCYKKGV